MLLSSCSAHRPVLALVTARASRGLDEDMPPLQAALRAAGAEVHVIDWDDPDVDWSDFDAAVLRSCWDYVPRLEEFLAWAERAATRTHLINPLPVIRWNTDKHYLQSLASAGVPLIASTFLEPGTSAGPTVARFLDHDAQSDFVVKPAVGAGSLDARRYPREEAALAVEHAERLLRVGRSVLLQPYMHRIDEDGETALIYFAGQLSHAIRKGPLLGRGRDPASGLFAAEQISSREPSREEIEVGRLALKYVAPVEPLAYARVDLVRDRRGTPHVLEIELTEPSLFLGHGSGSAERFAAVLVDAARSRDQALGAVPAGGGPTGVGGGPTGVGGGPTGVGGGPTGVGGGPTGVGGGPTTAGGGPVGVGGTTDTCGERP
jgi:O-ureido-D-serine cyclo-ligase